MIVCGIQGNSCVVTIVWDIQVRWLVWDIQVKWLGRCEFFEKRSDSTPFSLVTFTLNWFLFGGVSTSLDPPRNLCGR